MPIMNCNDSINRNNMREKIVILYNKIVIVNTQFHGNINNKLEIYHMN